MDTGVLTVLWVAAQVVLVVLAADFVGGLFHWAEDTFGDIDTPFWGAAFVRPNIGHHDRPTDILLVPWVRGARFILGAAVVVLAVCWWLDAITWQLLLFSALASCNDLAHRLEHTPTHRLPLAVKQLQRWHILQNARHHWNHHRAPNITTYCVLTPWLNPVLDRYGFWRGMERIFVPIFGAPRRLDLVRNKS